LGRKREERKTHAEEKTEDTTRKIAASNSHAGSDKRNIERESGERLQ